MEQPTTTTTVVYVVKRTPSASEDMVYSTLEEAQEAAQVLPKSYYFEPERYYTYEVFKRTITTTDTPASNG